MVAQQNSQKKDKKEKGALIACIVLFATYFINVLVGKVNISFGQNLPHLGNVAEFILLSMACVFLIIAALKDEAAEN